ncbi:MAG: hypothetical protein MJB14_05005 [Spirochaetes bacterium]|nr:hypothetical protein [Spirochaetota bacterium]
MENFDLPITIKSHQRNVLFVLADQNNISQAIIHKIKDHPIQDLKFHYQTIYLNQIKLNSCIHCGECIYRGAKYCPQKDDRQMLESIIKKNHYVIFLFLSDQDITSMIEIFIQRFHNIVHRPRFFQQKAILFFFKNKKIKHFYQSALLWGLDFFSSPVKIKNFKNSKKQNQHIDKKLKNFFTAININFTPSQPGFFNYLYFHYQRKKVFRNAKKNPADFIYWKQNNWFTNPYFYPIDHPDKFRFFQKILNWTFYINPDHLDQD